MQRKTRVTIANTLIAASALIGGVVITNQLDNGALFGSTATPANNAGNTSTAAADKTVQSDALNYSFGTIQLEVVRKGGKLTAINMLQAGATGGREQAFPTLIQAALQAQGSNFGNLTGATYTTETFKQALDNAISKLG